MNKKDSRAFAKKIVFWSFTAGFFVMTVLFVRMSFLNDRVVALYLAQESMAVIKERCFFAYERDFHKFHLAYDGTDLNVTFKTFGVRGVQKFTFSPPETCR